MNLASGLYQTVWNVGRDRRLSSRVKDKIIHLVFLSYSPGVPLSHGRSPNIDAVFSNHGF